ncbi:hypothetical protein FRB99_004202 [Tulasnella sp. 403]|nr:hypothetical protein FRB99_004202 [Tulasnella sp. 403]
MPRPDTGRETPCRANSRDQVIPGQSSTERRPPLSCKDTANLARYSISATPGPSTGRRSLSPHRDPPFPRPHADSRSEARRVDGHRSPSFTKPPTPKRRESTPGPSLPRKRACPEGAVNALDETPGSDRVQDSSDKMDISEDSRETSPSPMRKRQRAESSKPSATDVSSSHLHIDIPPARLEDAPRPIATPCTPNPVPGGVFESNTTDPQQSDIRAFTKAVYAIVGLRTKLDLVMQELEYASSKLKATPKDMAPPCGGRVGDPRLAKKAEEEARHRCYNLELQIHSYRSRLDSDTKVAETCMQKILTAFHEDLETSIKGSITAALDANPPEKAVRPMVEQLISERLGATKSEVETDFQELQDKCKEAFEIMKTDRLEVIQDYTSRIQEVKGTQDRLRGDHDTLSNKLGNVPEELRGLHGQLDTQQARHDTLAETTNGITTRMATLEQDYQSFKLEVENRERKRFGKPPLLDWTNVDSNVEYEGTVDDLRRSVVQKITELQASHDGTVNSLLDRITKSESENQQLQQDLQTRTQEAAAEANERHRVEADHRNTIQVLTTQLDCMKQQNREVTDALAEHRRYIITLQGEMRRLHDFVATTNVHTERLMAGAAAFCAAIMPPGGGDLTSPVTAKDEDYFSDAPDPSTVDPPSRSSSTPRNVAAGPGAPTVSNPTPAYIRFRLPNQ